MLAILNLYGYHMVMTKTELETIEETHALGYAVYYSEDGSREVDVEVCTHCEENAGFLTAARFPCEILEDARVEWDKQEVAKETAVIPVVIFDAETGIVTHNTKPEEAITCLGCMTPVEQCAQPKVHEFLYIPTDGARELGILSSVFYSDRGTITINTADTVSERD